MTRALVLGAAGFIGGHIARQALDLGWEVRGLRRRPGAFGHLDPAAPLRWFDGDLDRPATLPAAFDGVEIVFHAAAFYPRSTRAVPRQVARAVRQTRSVLDACRAAGIRRLVYTSSLSTIGPPPPGADRPADERDHYTPGRHPRSAYYECKYAMESEVLRAAADPEVVVLCPTAVFGPGDVHRAMGGLLLAVAAGRVPFWFEAAVNAVDVRDVAAAHLRAAQVGRPGERTILGGHNLRLRELLRAAAEVAGVAPPRLRLALAALDLAVALDDALPFGRGLGNHLRAVREWPFYDSRKAARELGLQPRPLADTLRDALAWYASRTARPDPLPVV